jgi:hypothetical protein
MALQRPLTREEFVIQSLLGMREPWVTVVDADVAVVEDDDPTVPMRQPPHEEPRPALDSTVFDLTFVPG